MEEEGAAGSVVANSMCNRCVVEVERVFRGREWPFQGQWPLQGHEVGQSAGLQVEIWEKMKWAYGMAHLVEEEGSALLRVGRKNRAREVFVCSPRLWREGSLLRVDKEAVAHNEA